MKKLKWSNIFKIVLYFIAFTFGFRKLNFPKDTNMKEIRYATTIFISIFMLFIILITFLTAHMFNLIFK